MSALKKKNGGLMMHPALDFLTSRVLTWTPLYGYHVSQNVDRFLRKRHPDIGKKSLSAMLPNPIFSAIGLHPNRQMSKEIGFDNFVKPDLAWKIFRQPCRKVPPAGGIGDRGFPLQARFDIKTLCLRETPAQRAGISPPPLAANCVCENRPRKNFIDKGNFA